MVFCDRKLPIFFQKTWMVLFYGRKCFLRNFPIFLHFFDVSHLTTLERYNTFNINFTSVVIGCEVSADINSVISLNFFPALYSLCFALQGLEGGGGGGGGVMINYANCFGGPTFFLHLEWGGSPQNW